ncbi:10613_t:CDS:2 [Cetraspora pellucida]|uniref:10613_t:CDS:1 n=1 Tax=Cetraspora pellucida TaxID=1433469 RepID=A0ACA9KGJ6_9GLOM|nr:10613_t:CDS:2 [Cetraspora pellucida]
MAPRLSRIRDTPYCFCKKPASPAYSEEFGLIYECANMHQNFWKKASDDYSNSNRNGDEPSKISANPLKPTICGFHIHKDTWDAFFDNPDRIYPYHPELSTCPFFNFTFCAYFRMRNNYPLSHPPPPLCFCGTPVVMRFSARDRRLMFVCRNYLIDGARPKCTWHVYADLVAFEKPNGCTHPVKKQPTVGLVEPETDKNPIVNVSLNDSNSISSNQHYIDPRGSIINFNGKNRQCHHRNKNNYYYLSNRRDLDYHSQDTYNNGQNRFNNKLVDTLKSNHENGFGESSGNENHNSNHRSPIQDDSHSANAHLEDDNFQIGSNYVSQLEASNKDLLDKVTKLEADNKNFSERAVLLTEKAERLEAKVASMQSEMNHLVVRIGRCRSECGSEVERRQYCQKKVMELQGLISDISKQRDNFKSLCEEERKERVSATHKCKVCFSEPITHAIFPCYHMALCGTCVEAVDKCVICRQNKESAIRIYIQ